MSKNKNKIENNELDTRSTYDTFMNWCDECTDEYYDYQGVLSIKGSDGINISKTRVGRARFDHPKEVDFELDREGYYEGGEIMCGAFTFTAPTKKYSDWFREKYPDTTV